MLGRVIYGQAFRRLNLTLRGVWPGHASQAYREYNDSLMFSNVIFS